MNNLKQKKFKIRAIEEKGYVKFYITHTEFSGRIKKHIGKGSLSDYYHYQNDFGNDLEQYFEGKTVSRDAVKNYSNDYVEKNKNVGSIFNYSDEFIELKRKTFNRRTKRYLSNSSINCYIKSIATFKKFLITIQLSELPEVLNDSVLNDFYNYLHSLSHNYRVKMHFRIKEFVTFLRIVKRLNIDESYLKSNFTEEYDNQETADDDRALTIDDMNKLNSLRNKFNLGDFQLKAYKKVKTIPDQLQTKQKATKQANLKRTLDCFLFMCATGLYVADINKKPLGIDDAKNGSFLSYRRAKNNSFCRNIPLFDYGCFLGQTLRKEYCIKSGANFPLNLSLNQFDKNMKIIGDLAGIDFKLTSKMARKTFASIYYFEYRININDIQIMLGHKDQKHTMHYLRIGDNEFQNRIQKQLGLAG